MGGHRANQASSSRPWVDIEPIKLHHCGRGWTWSQSSFIIKAMGEHRSLWLAKNRIDVILDPLYDLCYPTAQMGDRNGPQQKVHQWCPPYLNLSLPSMSIFTTTVSVALSFKVSLINLWYSQYLLTRHRHLIQGYCKCAFFWSSIWVFLEFWSLQLHSCFFELWNYYLHQIHP